MIQFDAWWLPDGETHLPEWMTKVNRRVDGRLTYQYHKYEAALKLCRSRRLAIDVGAHCALWSYWMAKDFADLIAFEPHPDHQSCWRRNMNGTSRNVTLFPYALGPSMGSISLKTGPSSSGDTYVDLTNPVGAIPQWPLDRFTITDLDFLKIDAEGYEVFIVRGARATLEKNRPVIIVEQKPGHGKKYRESDTAAMTLLQSWGYCKRAVIDGDVVMTPGEWE